MKENAGWLAHRKMKLVYLFCILAGTILISSWYTMSTEAASSKVVSINKEEISVTVGKTEKISIKNAGGNKVTFHSSNKKVAVVKGNGTTAVITGKKAGKCNITAKVGKKTYKCKVTVKNKTGISANSITLKWSKSKTLNFYNAKGTVKWTIKDKKIANIKASGSKVKVTGNEVGTTYLYAKMGGKTYKSKVQVTKLTNPKFAANQNNTVVVGNTQKLTIKDAVKGSKTWKSSNNKIATVNKNGVVTGIKAGNVQISCLVNGVTIQKKIVVINKVQEPIDLSYYNAKLDATLVTYNGNAQEPGVTVQNNADVLLKEGTDYQVSYTNNMNAGKAKATIKGIGKYTGTIEKDFTIDKARQKLTVSALSEWVIVGEDVQLKVDGIGPITYTSYNSGVATVDENGVVTGIKPGYVTINIEAKSNDNYSYAYTSINLKVVGGAKQEYSYELYVLNNYKIYASMAEANALLYIKTDNPDPNRIAIISDNGSLVSANSFDDVNYTGNNYNCLYSVEGGYIVYLQPSKIGMNTVTIWEAYEGCTAWDIEWNQAYDRYEYSKLYGCETAGTATFDAYDRNDAYEKWVEGIIAQCTNDTMTFHEKMSSICTYLLAEYRYPANNYGYDEDWRYLRLVSQYGAKWEVRRLDSASSPSLLMEIASRLGCTDMERLSGDLHAYVKMTFDGETVTYGACPYMTSNSFDPNELTYVDFSIY